MILSRVSGSTRAIRDRAVKVQFLIDCLDIYFEWYLVVPHPHIIPPRQHVDDVGSSHVGPFHVGSSHVGPSHDGVPSDDGVPSNDVSPPPYGVDDA